MKDPKIAILCPVYNQAKYMPSLCESIISQEYSNIHLIISNDASTDNTTEVLRKYLKPLSEKLTSVVFTDHLFNLGLSGRNNYKYLSTQIPTDCDYVSIIEGDDYIRDPQRYIKQLAALESSGSGAVHSDVTALYVNGTACEAFWKKYRITQTGNDPRIPEGSVFNSLVKGNFIYSCSLLVKRDLYLKAFDYDLITRLNIFLGDYAGLLRLSQLTNIDYVDESLMCYRVIPTSESHSNRNKVVEDTIRLQKLAVNGELFKDL